MQCNDTGKNPTGFWLQQLAGIACDHRAWLHSYARR